MQLELTDARGPSFSAYCPCSRRSRSANTGVLDGCHFLHPSSRAVFTESLPVNTGTGSN